MMLARVSPLVGFVILTGCAELLHFEVEGATAVMTGELGSDSPARVQSLLEDNPQLETIIMQDVPGSLDDVAALDAARLIHDAQLRIEVPADGEIASGGVDFFLAGSTRIVAEGGRVGVHSWSDGRSEGAELSADDAAHDLYLDFYASVGIAAEFYWFTLEAAGSRGIHWMTPGELEEYGVVTQ